MVSTMNPYESPFTASKEPPDTARGIADEIVDDLIRGNTAKTIHIEDVSDCHLYGCKHRRELGDERGAAATSQGLSPEIYQSTYWFCLVYLPVYPIATYAVIPFQDCEDSDSDVDQYRCIEVKTDWVQIGWTALLAWGSVAAVAAFFIYRVM